MWADLLGEIIPKERMRWSAPHETHFAHSDKVRLRQGVRGEACEIKRTEWIGDIQGIAERKQLCMGGKGKLDHTRPENVQLKSHKRCELSSAN